jgi:hypothetical protein
MSTLRQKPQRITKTHVERRLRDWRRRIEALFRQIEQWALEEWGEESVVWGAREQRHEYMMREFGVRPRKLPVLEVRLGKRQITFLPSCLWIIGANGRIDVTAGPSSYMLMDMGAKEGEPSDWQISNPDSRVVLEPFARKVFLRIANARA